MIDLTPLDVRNKRGDFKKGMRGYDPQEVDVFLELVAERLEAVVRENMHLRDRTQTLQEQVNAQSGREQAVQDALVTAQELRKDIREQSQREADHAMREAESEARRMIAEADAEVRARLRGVERQVDHARDALQELERRRNRFIQDFRGLLQRELDVVEVEEQRVPLETRTIELSLGGGARTSQEDDADDQGQDPTSSGGLEPSGATVEEVTSGGQDVPDARSSEADIRSGADPTETEGAPGASGA
ncbi:MAG: DivIVA domain-containing protein, partial [Gemmatimonadota bacterium]|nr:DivIVA domain-containing protein [Gemmatimonadota bacterium]